MTKIKTYSELRQLHTFEERYRYLKLQGVVGEATFGFDRVFNQQFYRSREWRKLRLEIIVRDNGCDMGVDGFEIFDQIIIHHMNPMTVEDIVEGDNRILDPEFLICVTLQTHNAIHFGDESKLPRQYVERQPGDTRLWTRVR